jgi:alkylhydroperoxidase/carboxymuconolactone decarboxylase family protein YurZ
MQEATDDEAEASFSTENVEEEPNLNGTFVVCRKVAKRTLPWDLVAGELHIVPSSSLSPLQAEDIPPARKRPCLEEPLPTTTDEAAREIASPNVSVGLPPPAVEKDDANANADLVTDTQMNAGATTANRRWTSEEDAKLTSAVPNASKKKRGKEYTTDWAAAAELVPGRTNIQCRDRWKIFLDPSIDRTSGRKGGWTANEDKKLKDAVLSHGSKDWAAIAALVPGRTRRQCQKKWHTVLDKNIDPTTARAGKWSAIEDIKLKDAVQIHGGKNWVGIAALVPGRTMTVCRQRWHDALNPSITLTAGRTGKWVEDEDIKLKDAVQIHGGKDWVAVAALVPGRTHKQCYKRWNDQLDPWIKRAHGRTGTWTADEAKKLKDAVLSHGSREWAAIAALVPGRTKIQCQSKWRDDLGSSIDPMTARAGTWTEDEDSKLKDAVQEHGSKNWDAIAALVPGRTRNQCRHRWKYYFMLSRFPISTERLDTKR